MLERLRILLVVLLLQLSFEPVGVEARIPDLDVPLPCEGTHCLAIGANDLEHGGATLGLPEAAISAGDLEARREAFEVPLERPGQRLVEVVDVEDEIPLGRGEAAEVRQVCVAAKLSFQARPRCPREVVRHDRGRTPIEGERGDEHASVTDRDQLWHPRGPLPLEQRNGVAVRCELERSVALPRDVAASRLPGRFPLGRRELSRSRLVRGLTLRRARSHWMHLARHLPKNRW